MFDSNIILTHDNFAFRDFITVVSGLPRSGTSMMMKMLDLGKMPVLSDGIREPDTDNPKGYYELEMVKNLGKDNSWLDTAKGKAIKVVSPLLQHLLLGAGLRYRIIFMLRNLDEILASQKKMSDRLTHGADHIKDSILKQNYSNHIEEIRVWMDEKEDIDFMFINYRDVLNDPVRASEEICSFLDVDLDIHDMASVVEDQLYRQRSNKTGISEGTADLRESPDRELIMDKLRQLGYL